MGAQSSGFIGRARPQLPARYEGKLDRMMIVQVQDDHDSVPMNSWM